MAVTGALGVAVSPCTPLVHKCQRVDGWFSALSSSRSLFLQHGPLRQTTQQRIAPDDRHLSAAKRLSRLRERRVLASTNALPSGALSAPTAVEELEKKFGSEEGPPTSHSNGRGTLPYEPAVVQGAGFERPGEKFDWATKWYPVAIAADLQKDRPHAIHLLGNPIVLWWDRNAAKWQAFLDVCPHRLAPLSEGRIHESGDLQCSYHGWTFAGPGNCTMIPQAPKNGPKVHESPRACAKVYPAVEHQGMVWVFPTYEHGAAALAAQTPLPTVPELDDPNFVYDLNGRDLPYSYEILIENLMDPAHVPFAHHKIMGNRDQGKPLQLSVDKIDVNGYTGKGERGVVEFIAPAFFQLKITLPHSKKELEKAEKTQQPLPPQKRMVLIFWCTPSGPGRSKSFFAFPRNFAQVANRLVPRFFFHLGQNKILDSDLYFLYQQERRLQEQFGGAENWMRACYVPTASDVHVTAFRRWLSSFGGGRPTWGPGVSPQLPPTPPKEQLMERYHSHTKQCRSCRNALTAFERLNTALWATSFLILAALVLASTFRESGLTLYVALPLVLLSGACALAASRMPKFIKESFYFRDYVHALVK